MPETHPRFETPIAYDFGTHTHILVGPEDDRRQFSQLGTGRPDTLDSPAPPEREALYEREAESVDEWTPDAFVEWILGLGDTAAEAAAGERETPTMDALLEREQ